MEQKEYFDDLIKIKETITENRNKAMVVVNSAMIITYYQIGTIINQRKAWGNRYIKLDKTCQVKVVESVINVSCLFEHAQTDDREVVD